MASPPAKAFSFVTAAPPATDALNQIAADKSFRDAGKQIIIEERLDGHEASLLAITDSRTILTLPAAQDHKAAFDGDTGPNTGGMGAYCPHASHHRRRPGAASKNKFSSPSSTLSSECAALSAASSMPAS